MVRCGAVRCGAVLTWAPATQVEGQSVGELVLTLHQPLGQLHLTRLPAVGMTHNTQQGDQANFSVEFRSHSTVDHLITRYLVSHQKYAVTPKSTKYI